MQNRNILIFLTFFLLFCACTGGKDKGLLPGDPELPELPTGNGDEPDGDMDGETEMEREIVLSRCGDASHWNDVDILAESGGEARFCLGGTEADGAMVRLDAGALSADVHITISRTDDLSLDGYTPVGPAILFRALPLYQGDLATLSEPAVFRIPFSPVLAGHLAGSDIAILHRAGDPLDPGRSEAVVRLDVVPSASDLDASLAVFDAETFGIFQAAVSED